MGNILDGKALARKLKDELKVQVEELRKQTGHVPHLVNVLIGDSHDACAYANSQKRVAEYIGINYELKILPENITQNELVETIQQLNHDTRVHGIMLHKPVPESINYAEVANSVNTSKDLEGVNITNIGKMMLGKTELIPCTPASIMEHIKSSGVDIRGKEAVVVGDSEIVGKPVSLLLLKEEATVTICHVATSQGRSCR